MVTISEAVRHPVAIAAGTFAAVASMLKLGVIAPIVLTIWASIPDLFTLTSVVAFTIAPRVEWLPGKWLSLVALVFAALWVGKISLRFSRKLGKRFNDDK